ncbi:MAG: hypothetical protein AAGG11_23330 [Pseudomonadota bacterium]
MALFLARYWSLGVLRVHLDDSKLIPEVICRVIVNREGQAESEVWREIFKLEEFTQPSLPARLIDRVRSWCDSDAQEESVLWVHLVKPYGELGAVPWEHLQNTLKIPVLRLPDVLPKEPPPEGRLDIACCISAPAVKESIDPVQWALAVSTALEAMYREVNIHFFVHEDAQENVRDALSGKSWPHTWHVPQWPGESQDHIFDSNPWIDWLTRASKTQNFDLIHFVCHGFRSQRTGRSMLSLAGSPAEGGDSHASHLNSTKTLRLLDTVGAYGAVFSSPQGNYSVEGMRMVADAVGVRRSGPVMMHDTNLATDYALGLGYELILGKHERPLEPNSGLLFYVQPEIVLQGNSYAPPREDLGAAFPEREEATIRAAGIEKNETDPAWEAVLARFANEKQFELDQLMKMVSSKNADSNRSAYARGIESALSDIRELLKERHGNAGSGNNNLMSE